LTIARGLTPRPLRLRRHEIDEVNHRMAPFRVLQGAEVDILPNGSLDLPAPALAELDYVSISVHSAFSMGREEMTKRIIRGIGHPGVASLNHPTGRLIEKRPGYAVDLEAVLRAAAAAGVAVEIDSEMHRLDLDDVWSRRAKDLGCSLVVDSDAHSPRDFQNLTYGVAVARRGWLGSANVLNTLPLNELEGWLVDKKRRVA